MGWGRGNGVLGPSRLVVEEAEAKHLSQDSRRGRVDGCHTDLAGLHRSRQGGAKKGAVLLLVQSGVRGSDCGVRGAVVGADEARKAPPLLEDREQRRVLARVGPVRARVAAHHRASLALDHRVVERGQVDLVQRALVDDVIVGGRVAVGLDVVDRVVLDLRDRPLRLDALDLSGRDCPGQQRILAERLKVPTPARIAVDVDCRSVDDVVALGPFLGAEHLAVLPRLGRIPCRGIVDRRRQLRGTADPIGHARRPVLLRDLGDAQVGDGVGVADRAVGRVPVVALHEVQLVSQRHLGQQHGDAA